MKVTNFGSNMTEVETKDGVSILVSYSTPVACHIPGEGFKRTEKKWSVATSRHINKWISHHGGSGNSEIKPQKFFDDML